MIISAALSFDLSIRSALDALCRAASPESNTLDGVPERRLALPVRAY